MRKKALAEITLLILFLYSMPICAKGSPCAEIFNTTQNIVLKSVQVDSEIYNMAKGWIKNIDNFCGKINPSAVEGYKVRIPLDPPVKVNKQSINADVREVYIIVPQDKPPFFIIFDNKNKPSYFKFYGSIDSLSKALDFKLRN